MEGAKFGFTRLSYDNYETWKRRARQFLTREGLWSYVVGDAKAEVKKSPEWAAKDDLALQTIGYLVDDALQREIEEAATAKEAWEMLRKYFVKDSSVGKVALIKRLSKMELAEGGDVREFLLNMEELFEKMGNVGIRMDEDLKACFVLANLPDSFDSTVSSIHGRMEVLSMMFVKTKLMEEYDRRKNKIETESEKAMVVRSAAKDKRYTGPSRLCYACSSPDHLMRDCDLLKKVRAEDERSKSGGKQNRALSATVEEESGSFSGEICLAAIQEETTEDWYLDSGASVHMTGRGDLLDQAKLTPITCVKFADGQVLQSAGKGEVNLRTRNGNGYARGVKLVDVKYVPGLTVNLVSVSAIVAKGFEVVFRKNDCCVVKDGKVMLVAEKVGKLYKLN